MIPHGSIAVADGTAPQTFDATARKMWAFDRNGGHASSSDGDLSVTPQFASDRVRCKPGVYKVDFQGGGSSTLDVGTFTFFLRKNQVEISDLGTAYTIDAVGDSFHVAFSGIIELTLSDADSAQNIDLEIYGESSFEESSNSSSNSSSSSSSNSSSSSSTNSSSSSTSSSTNSSSSSSTSSSQNSSSSSTSTGEESSSTSTSSSTSSSSNSSSTSSSNSSSSSSVLGGPRLTFDFAQLTVVRVD